MNLSEREQRFLAELYEAFPDAREVTEAELAKRDVALQRVESQAVRVHPVSYQAASPSASVTSQVSLFGQEG